MIELKCGCGNRSWVSDELANKVSRCPACRAVFLPLTKEAIAAAPGHSPFEAELVRRVESLTRSVKALWLWSFLLLALVLGVMAVLVRR
jgi:hypothetical protein